VSRSKIDARGETVKVLGEAYWNGEVFMREAKKLAGFMQKTFLRKKLDSQIFFRVE